VEPLLSASWYRIAGLKPRLVQQVKIVRQPVRGEVWHVLAEASSGRQLRLNTAAWEFAGRCDGMRTVAQLWDLLVARLGADAPTQDDILRLVSQLHRGGMLQFDAAPDLSMLFQRRDEESRGRRRTWINPLLLKMKLFDPTRLLDRLEPAVRPLLGRGALIVWAVAVVLAALACIIHFPQLRAEAITRVTTPRMLWLAWLCYPVIKALHELGHAIAVRRYGGPVHEMGITLLMLTPAPYVDASAANSFERRGHRVAVSSAGIMVELALAAIAAAIWFAVEPGLVRDIAFVTLLICSVSTLLFNGNPLLRLDGYYVFTDAVDLPNLAARSSAWWSAWGHRLLRGQASVPDAPLGRGERKWLIAFAPLSSAYRLVLLFALIFWIGSYSWLLGWLAALVLVGVLLMRFGASMLRASGGNRGLRARAMSTIGAIGVVAALLLFVVPAPNVVVARGVVWPPERAQLRPEVSGFVAQAPAGDGTEVAAGQVLLTLSEPALEAERARRASQLSGLQAQQYQALLENPARAADIAQDIARSEAELARAEQQVEQLQVRSQLAGRLVLPKPEDLAGSYAPRGAMLGYILGGAPANVRAVLDEQDVLQVRNRIRAIDVRLADQPGTAVAASLNHEVPGATRTLPSAVLGQSRGGPFAVDPSDKEGLRTTAPVFLVDVSVPGYQAGRIGSRAWVRFDLGYEPIGLQWTRRLRQLLLRQFNPVGQV
jgi:putative peptide zinc metalloprotease protein